MVSGRYLRSLYETYVVVRERVMVRVEELARVRGVSKRQVLRHLASLERAGLVERREDFGEVVAFCRDSSVGGFEAFVSRVVEAFSRDDRELGAYDVAFVIKEEVRRAGLEADLFGACKIHELVSWHSRVTADINLVVSRRHVEALASLLTSLRDVPIVYSGESSLVYADYRFSVLRPYVSVLVLVGGVKHLARPGVRIYDLSRFLEGGGELSLEHAVAAKLLAAPRMRRKEDGYDIAVSLAEGADPRTIAQHIAEVLHQHPDYKPVVTTNLQIYHEYLKYYIDLPDPLIIKVKKATQQLEQELQPTLQPTNQKQHQVSV